MAYLRGADTWRFQTEQPPPTSLPVRPSCRQVAIYSLRLLPGRVVRVANLRVSEGTVESATVIGVERQTLLESSRQVRVADEVASIQQAVVGVGLHKVP